MKITILGLGYIGDSLSLNLKAIGFCSQVVGVDKDPENCNKALKLGIADDIKPLEEALDSEIIIPAVPVPQIAELLPKVMSLIGDNTVVMDVGSTKNHICKAIKKHPKRKQFVGTHPITGDENSGPESAIKNLFDNKTRILFVDDSALWAAERASELYEALHMQLVFMKAEDHDKHAGYVSHLSHVSSFALASTVLDLEKNTATIFDLASSGFACSARLEKSSAHQWTLILDQNSKHVSKALGTYIKHLTKFKKNIDKKNTKAIHEAISKANNIRKILK